MKKIHRVLALLMAVPMAIGLMTTAFAATGSVPTIDPGKKASLSIYKYDITTASKDGAWDVDSYVSTGLHDDAAIDKLSKYAIQGVEFTYLRVADIAMNSEVVAGQRQVGVLYGFDSSERSNAVLSAIGLPAADAHKTDNGINYFTSDMLNNKLATALTANATTVKNALEAAVKNGGVAMTETDATGHASADQLEQGLYLVVETRVPENVTSTCNPFFVSLPMTTVDGAAWSYDVTVYPKNQTGNPDLGKTVREAKNSTGKNTGSLTDIKDGYPELLAALQEYNHQLYAEKQCNLVDLEACEEPAVDLAAYGIDDEIIGVLEIPAMELTMPVYLGALDDHLAAGATVLGNTSAPIGGDNTNCVIAGHRGWRGADYFRYIDRLQVGDTVTLTNLWETLTYTVTDIQIIQPHEVDKIKIQQGRDLLTLLTCHPYASGGRQRYVVCCERTEAR